VTQTYRLLSNNWIFWLLTVPFAALLVAPMVDQKMRPPVSLFSINGVSYVDDSVFIRGEMYKRRCVFAGINVTGIKHDGTEVHVPLRFFDNDVDDTANRAYGLQSWGPWRLQPPAGVIGITMVASHRCRLLDAHWLPDSLTKYTAHTTIVEDYPMIGVKK
jgi:hypothetical protein